MEEQNLFANSRVNITAEGKKTHRFSYREYRTSWWICERFSKRLDSQLNHLSTIAETQPQAAYLAFASGFKNKLKYFLITIPNIWRLLLPLQRTIRNKFIPTVTGGLVDILTLTGVSNWLTVLSITEFVFEWSKQQFLDSIRLQYGWENMQSTNMLPLR